METDPSLDKDSNTFAAAHLVAIGIDSFGLG